MKMSLVTFLLILLPSVFAGDIIKKGEILKEDSYVFSIDEAERLKQRLAELEKKEKILLEYEKINALMSRKDILYKDLDETYKLKEENYNKIIKSLELENERYREKVKYNDLENNLIIGGTVITTVLTFIAVDYINDNYIDK